MKCFACKSKRRLLEFTICRKHNGEMMFRRIIVSLWMWCWYRMNSPLDDGLSLCIGWRWMGVAMWPYALVENVARRCFEWVLQRVHKMHKRISKLFQNTLVYVVFLSHAESFKKYLCILCTYAHGALGGRTVLLGYIHITVRKDRSISERSPLPASRCCAPRGHFFCNIQLCPMFWFVSFAFRQ